MWVKKNLGLGRYLCPNHLAKSLQFSANNPVERAPIELNGAAELN
jgi:hypothetical protein